MPYGQLTSLTKRTGFSFALSEAGEYGLRYDAASNVLMQGIYRLKSEPTVIIDGTEHARSSGVVLNTQPIALRSEMAAATPRGSNPPPFPRTRRRYRRVF